LSWGSRRAFAALDRQLGRAVGPVAADVLEGNAEQIKAKPQANAFSINQRRTAENDVPRLNGDIAYLFVRLTRLRKSAYSGN
jgi:hypothetical protein